jgi:cyclohexanone monooxygenase
MKSVDVIIVGAGFAGLYALHLMKQDGRRAIVLEATDAVGGVWNRNRYPGARCDTESLQYSYSFSEDLQQEWCWSERYAGQTEILRYAEHVVDRFDLRKHIEFGVMVRSAHWSKRDRRWSIVADSGAEYSARFVVFATGSLTTPNVPDIPGLEKFEGDLLHTAQWPRELVSLAGKRVGVIGTGSTGVQVITELAKEVGQLTVFQRTANYVLPARNMPLTEQIQREWKADYVERRQLAKQMPGGLLGDFNDYSALSVGAEARDAEYEARWAAGGFPIMLAFNDLLTNQVANDTMAEFVRRKIKQRVYDPETARKLLPTEFPIGTKRVCMEQGYYEAFNQPNVELVYLKEQPITGAASTGLYLGERLIDLDALVFATGFDAITGTISGMKIHGEIEDDLASHWQKGPRSYLGLGVAGFPNLFLVSGPGSPIGRSNAISSIEQNVNFIASLIRCADERKSDHVEPTLEAEDAWVKTLAELAERTLYGKAKSWWNGSNIPGKPRVFMIYAGGVPAYLEACNDEASHGFPNFLFA